MLRVICVILLGIALVYLNLLQYNSFWLLTFGLHTSLDRTLWLFCHDVFAKALAGSLKRKSICSVHKKVVMIIPSALNKSHYSHLQLHIECGVQIFNKFHLLTQME